MRSFLLQMTDAFQETRGLFEKLLDEMAQKVEKEGFGSRIESVGELSQMKGENALLGK